MVLREVEARRRDQRAGVVGGEPDDFGRAGLGVRRALEPDQRLHDLFETVPVVGLGNEHGLGFRDGFLEALEAQQDIGLVAVVGGLLGGLGRSPG